MIIATLTERFVNKFGELSRHRKIWEPMTGSFISVLEKRTIDLEKLTDMKQGELGVIVSPPPPSPLSAGGRGGVEPPTKF